jgi:hypothetical protein
MLLLLIHMHTQSEVDFECKVSETDSCISIAMMASESDLIGMVSDRNNAM